MHYSIAPTPSKMKYHLIKTNRSAAAMVIVASYCEFCTISAPLTPIIRIFDPDVPNPQARQYTYLTH